MSSFFCNFCGKACLDSPQGYITGCIHYPNTIGCVSLDIGLKTGVITVNNEYGCYQILTDIDVSLKTEEE